MFYEFSAKSDVIKLYMYIVFNSTKFSVKPNANQVALFNLTRIMKLQYHSVVISKIFPHDFLAKIPSKYFFTKELCYKLISRKFLEVGVNFRNFHTVRLLSQQISTYNFHTISKYVTCGLLHQLLRHQVRNYLQHLQ